MSDYTLSILTTKNMYDKINQWIKSFINSSKNITIKFLTECFQTRVRYSTLKTPRFALSLPISPLNGFLLVINQLRNGS